MIVPVRNGNALRCISGMRTPVWGGKTFLERKTLHSGAASCAGPDENRPPGGNGAVRPLWPPETGFPLPRIEQNFYFVQSCVCCQRGLLCWVRGPYRSCRCRHAYRAYGYEQSYHCHDTARGDTNRLTTAETLHAQIRRTALLLPCILRVRTRTVLRPTRAARTNMKNLIAVAHTARTDMSGHWQALLLLEEAALRHEVGEHVKGGAGRGHDHRIPLLRRSGGPDGGGPVPHLLDGQAPVVLRLLDAQRLQPRVCGPQKQITCLVRLVQLIQSIGGLPPGPGRCCTPRCAPQRTDHPPKTGRSAAMRRWRYTATFAAPRLPSVPPGGAANPIAFPRRALYQTAPLNEPTCSVNDASSFPRS